MEASKVEKIGQFRLWLIEHDIQFVEKTAGHFQIFDPLSQDLIYQVWATTEKIMDNPTVAENRQQWIGQAQIYKILESIGCNPVRQKLLNAFNDNRSSYTKLVVAIQLPTQATEIIINTEGIHNKLAYYVNNYDDTMHLKSCTDIKMLDFMII
ncbi:MAG: hypothetical protein RR324_01285 [Cellulosilyticaceae bacterium]